MGGRVLTLLLGVGFLASCVLWLPKAASNPLPGQHTGFSPVQPIAYSHKLHAGELGIGCTYCHWAADKSRHAGIPARRPRRARDERPGTNMARRSPFKIPRIPEMTVRRLSVYTRSLQQLEEDGVKTISSQELAERFSLNSAQVRKDLSHFGSFGKRGLGYRVDELRGRLRQILEHLVENAVKYAPPDTMITVESSSEASRAAAWRICARAISGLEALGATTKV